MGPCEKLYGPKTQARKAAFKQRVSVIDYDRTQQTAIPEERYFQQFSQVEMNDVCLVFVQGCPTKPLSVYDPSIDPADGYILQYAYREASNPEKYLLPIALLLRLFLKFAWYYSPGIVHG